MAKQAKSTPRNSTKGRAGANGKAKAPAPKSKTEVATTETATTTAVAARAPIEASDLPLEQVQAMLRLVGETAELWYDPKLQRKYMLESLCRLLSSRAGICFGFGD